MTFYFYDLRAKLLNKSDTKNLLNPNFAAIKIFSLPKALKPELVLGNKSKFKSHFFEP